MSSRPCSEQYRVYIDILSISINCTNLLFEQDVQARNHSPLYNMNEIRNHNHGDMWLDVDRMSYEVFVMLSH